jgi:tRNA threonylcarbamoyladenosine biosynthesis protein TsaE
MLESSQKITLENREATLKLGELLGQNLSAGIVILLEGDLGSGKTTLVQGLGKGLGLKEPIVSPTFTLINEYLEGRIPLYHLDLYRLEGATIEQLHIESYWDSEEVELGIVAIEWAKRLPYKPEKYLEIKLIYTPQNTRQATLRFVGMEAVILGFLQKLSNE